MASSELSIDEIFVYFKENGCMVQNRELVHYFKHYLTNPASKDDARKKFKKYVNILAHTRLEGDVKYLELKTKFKDLPEYPKTPTLLQSPPPLSSSPHYDSRNSLGIPVAPEFNTSPSPRQPPPYRPPPPVSSPSNSCDNISLGSVMSLLQDTPQPPPRRRTSSNLLERQKSLDDLEPSTPKKQEIDHEEKQAKVSVRERLEKFNRLASVEDELSPARGHTPKSAEKQRNVKGVLEDDGASVTSLDPKKCMEWYVTASKGDVQELVKLANNEPRLVNRKDPFTSVLHWGAKLGKPEIIKLFAGKYKVDVNGKTNGGYTPLHLAAQFGHEQVYEILLKTYRADESLRDYSGRLPVYYKKNNKEQISHHPKIKTRKKQSDKDLGFLRIGSLNVRVKKTTEAFSNFLGVGGGGSINPLESIDDKVHKGWGSADNLSQENSASKAGIAKKKSKRPYSSGLNSVPGTPKQLMRNVNPRIAHSNDSDSDSAAGFDSQWK